MVKINIQNDNMACFYFWTMCVWCPNINKVVNLYVFVSFLVYHLIHLNIAFLLEKFTRQIFIAISRFPVLYKFFPSSVENGVDPDQIAS